MGYPKPLMIWNTVDRDVEIARDLSQGVTMFKTRYDLLMALGFEDSEMGFSIGI